MDRIEEIRERLAKIEAACPDWEAAYGGPTGHKDGVIWMDRHRGRYLYECTATTAVAIGDSGATLRNIASMPSDIRDLLAEVDRLRANEAAVIAMLGHFVENSARP